ncbi:hypothetical protein ABZ442_05820 [Streptomyces triculaminicus]|uniref:hypothetical protein n=1 Tax=Streptomyces triculaminicus TaxID=2816232 RepID=UPI0033E97114
MPDLKSGSKKQDVLILAFTVLPAGAAPAITWIGRNVEGAMKFALIALIVILATAPPLWSFWQHKKSRLQERTRREALLAPIIDYIGESITKPSEAPAKAAQIHERLAPLLAESLGGGARCAFYSYDAKNERFIKEVASGGPNGTPDEIGIRSEKFSRLRHVMEQKVPVYTKDILDPDAQLNFTLGGGYRSILAQGAWAGEEVQGVLIVDAPNPGDLTRAKVPETYVWVFASLFGASNALRIAPTG